MDEEKSPFLFSSQDVADTTKEPEDVELVDVTASPTSTLTFMRLKHWAKGRSSVLIALLIMLCAIVAIIIALIILIATLTSKTNIREEICSNPPVLLISLDGFKADYLSRNLTPNIHALIEGGVRAPYMRSVWPSKTFPNHYSIVTGLHPESHGIVANTFYDMKLKNLFRISKAAESIWWQGEPIWVTAAINGLISGVYFWPGSEAEIGGHRPDYYFHYDFTVPFDSRVDTVLGWLDLPKKTRPQFLSMYFNEPDHSGHQFGPNSKEVDEALKRVDNTIGRLWTGLKAKDLEDCINIVIVSDHGMSELNSNNVNYVSEYFPTNYTSTHNISISTRGVSINMGIEDSDVVEEAYTYLIANDSANPRLFRTFHLENLPLRLHAGHFNKQRYGPLYLLADDHGLVLVNNKDYKQQGNHGYDNIEKTMQALFIGHGPAFRKGFVSEPFLNVQLYSLMCGLLKINPAANNGTVGALYDLLDPDVAATLPAPKARDGTPGTDQMCPFPQDETTFTERSTCEECICRDLCSNVTDDEILDSNRQSFNLSQSQVNQFQARHFPWGVPAGGRGSGACVLTQQHYVNIYSNVLRIPLLLGYTIDTKIPSVPEVVGCYRRDPRVEPMNSANCTLYNFTADATYDYIDTPMDLSYLADWVEEEEVLPFALSLLTSASSSGGDQGLPQSVLSNAVPQLSVFIEEVWGPVLSALKDWVNTYGALNIMMGSGLDANRDGLRDPDSAYPNIREGVAIPSHMFVVATRCTKEGVGLGSCEPDDLEALGMLFQHPLETGDYADAKRVLRYALTPIRDIEALTGINFFPTLTAAQQNRLELRLFDELWPTSSL